MLKPFFLTWKWGAGSGSSLKLLNYFFRLSVIRHSIDESSQQKCLTQSLLFDHLQNIIASSQNWKLKLKSKTPLECWSSDNGRHSKYQILQFQILMITQYFILLSHEKLEKHKIEMKYCFCCILRWVAGAIM